MLRRFLCDLSHRTPAPWPAWANHHYSLILDSCLTEKPILLGISEAEVHCGKLRSQIVTAHRWRRLRPWHPYYWGAFILQGAARDPASPRRSRGTPCHQSRHAGRWVPLHELLRGGKRGFHIIYQLEAGVSPGARLACCSCSMSSHIFVNMNCLKSLAPFSPDYGESWWA